ncbi:hypothetical protein KQI41_12105 [Tissierella pigra]|uniref:phage tail terminator family protein n=1 Tax=Tissierella pigra TaxID=2607614 RepID=UPI001C0F74E2|nr:hypothetical protein [Tissierella pigra]MBU5427159.1 hypothetical protein [Tissierella pigra]
MIKIVKYTDIYKAIVKRIKTKFPNIVFSTDVEKDVVRPSFFIELNNIKISDFMREARDTYLTARIYYFSSTADENGIELLNMYDDLVELFLENNLITVDEYVKFEINELEINVIDKVLHCYFDIRISESYPRDKSGIGVDFEDKELMEELNIKE